MGNTNGGKQKNIIGGALNKEDIKYIEKMLAGQVKSLVYKELCRLEIIPRKTLYIHKTDGPNRSFDPYNPESVFPILSTHLHYGRASIDDLLFVMSNNSNLNLNDLKLLFNISMFDDQINNLNKQKIKEIFIKWWEEYLSSHPEKTKTLSNGINSVEIKDEDAPPYNITVDEFQQIFLKMFNELFNEYNIIIELTEA